MEEVKKLGNRVTLSFVLQLVLAVGLVFTLLTINRLADAIARQDSQRANGIPSVPPELADYSVRIRTISKEMEGSSGSGVMISPSHLVTNYHVVKPAIPVTKLPNAAPPTVWVDVLTDKGYEIFMGTVVGMDPARDLALVELPKKIKFNRWAKLSSEKTPTNAPIVAITCPNGHLPLVTTGWFGRTSFDGRDEMSILAFWGSSGGPVYDLNTRELVSLLQQVDPPKIQRAADGSVMFVSFATHLFYGIPSTWIREFIEAHGVSN
jgi:S1-C subfamily serine protease